MFEAPSDLMIEVFDNINDKPTAPTIAKAGNGPHLIQKHNDLVTATDAALDELTFPQVVELGSSYVGGFVDNNKLLEQRSLACKVNPNSAFAIKYRTTYPDFKLHWSSTFEPNIEFCGDILLLGRFDTETLSFNWFGRFPQGFGMYWYKNLLFAENKDLQQASPNCFNFSISNTQKELHFYNATSYTLNVLCQTTYINYALTYRQND